MKAKKFVSLLLSIAMISTFTSVFAAAPEGYEDYVQTFAGVYSAPDVQDVVTGGTRPGNDLRAEVTIIEELTADEFEANYGETFEDYGVAETDKFFLLEISYHNIGDVFKSVPVKNKYTGWTVIGAAMELHFPDSIIEYGNDFDGDGSPDSDFVVNGLGNTAINMADDSIYNFVFSVSQPAQAFPSVTNKAGQSTSATEISALQWGVFAAPGTEVELKNVNLGYMSYDNSAKTKQKDGTTDFDKEAYAPWHPATITLGEGGEDKTVTTETDSTNGATKIKYGADVPAAEQTLAGKYIVMNTATTAAGLTKDSRVVVTYTDTDGLGLSNSVEYGKTIFEYLGLEDSEGTVTTKAIKFGVVYTDARYKAANFSFEIK